MNLRELLPEKCAAKGQWWSRAWTLVEGCTKVSTGCRRCWAEALAMRFPNRYRGLTTMDGWTGEVVFREERWDAPLYARKPAIWSVWNDLFHEMIYHSLGLAWLAMSLAERHAFLVLTKRARRMRKLLEGEDSFVAVEAANEAVHIEGSDDPEAFLPREALELLQRRMSYGDGTGMYWPLPNVGLGVSVEDQETADERIPELLATPAALRFVNVGPLLGPIDLDGVWGYPGGADGELLSRWPIGWLIVECESGPGRRPCELEWVEDLVEQCKAAGVPCWVKQVQIGDKRRISRDMSEWPESIRVREMPELKVLGDRC